MIRLLAHLPEILMLLIFAGGAALIVWYVRAFYAERGNRQKKAREHRMRYGGECILEWNGSFADGPVDPEFGKLVVEIPRKRGSGAACFYERGLVLENKRLPYGEIKDVLLAEATTDKKYTLKQAVRDMGVLWIYPQKGTAMGIREMSYHFDNEIMKKIKQGLGF